MTAVDLADTGRPRRDPRPRPAASLDDRLAALGELGERAADQARALEDAAVAVLPFPRRVIRGDIALAVTRLRALPGLRGELDGRDPVGEVALSLPGNAILSNPLATVASSYLAGNHTRVRLLRARHAWAEVVRDLVAASLGDAVAFHGEAGPDFLARALADPDVGTVVLFGATEWAANYQDAVRASGTRFVFEGPGKDPFLVLDCAAVAEAAEAFVTSGCHNAGQACTAPERCYVVAEAYPEFVDRVVDLAGRLPTGDPRDEDTVVGPLTPDGAARAQAQVVEAVERGARVLCGGRPRDMDVNGEPRALLAPTVVDRVDHGMRLLREETFAPVLPVAAVASVEQAVALAEDSPYGLAATVFGGPAWVRDRLARTHGEVFSDETWLAHRRRRPLAPYGGRRQSGWVWEWADGRFVRRDGPRLNVHEMSRPRGRP